MALCGLCIFSLIIWIVLRHPLKREISRDEALVIARSYLQKNFPAWDISQHPPTVTYWTNHWLAGGKNTWSVCFAIPAIDKNGNKTMVRDFYNASVYVLLDGAVTNVLTSTP